MLSWAVMPRQDLGARLASLEEFLHCVTAALWELLENSVRCVTAAQWQLLENSVRCVTAATAAAFRKFRSLRDRRALFAQPRPSWRYAPSVRCSPARGSANHMGKHVCEVWRVPRGALG